MYGFLLFVHLLICFSLVAVVLVQSGKGGGLAGGAFGGSAQTVFGGRGATDFITRATMVLGGAVLRDLAHARAAVHGAAPHAAEPGAGSRPSGPRRRLRSRRRAAARRETAVPGSRPRAAPAASGRPALRRSRIPDRDRGPFRKSRAFVPCPGGGTGRHVRLRGVWGNPCEFKSRPGHQTVKAPRGWRGLVASRGNTGFAAAPPSPRPPPTSRNENAPGGVLHPARPPPRARSPQEEDLLHVPVHGLGVDVADHAAHDVALAADVDRRRQPADRAVRVQYASSTTARLNVTPRPVANCRTARASSSSVDSPSTTSPLFL